MDEESYSPARAQGHRGQDTPLEISFDNNKPTVEESPQKKGVFGKDNSDEQYTTPSKDGCLHKKDADIDPADKHRREKDHILKVLHGKDDANWQLKVENPNIMLHTVV